MKRWVIRYKRTDRYYLGESWDKLNEDYRPTWGEVGDTNGAETFTSKDGADKYIKLVLCSNGIGCEAVEVDV